MSRRIDPTSRQRIRLDLNGVVQGVGFRPYIYRLATELGLAGSVYNHSQGVTVEIEGSSPDIETFQRRLAPELPPLAKIDKSSVQFMEPNGDCEFVITASEDVETASTIIPPDIATCADCLSELFDPADRRSRYPFINCTNCGPRYTIVESIPYDRPFTSMKSFPLCSDCDREYHDPTNRRFHAQPNACEVCGPRLTMHDGKNEIECEDPIAAVVAILRDGKVVAIRGVGGFHLAVDAANETAVRTLRERKRREEKPLAMMAPEMHTIRKFCEVTLEEEELLGDYTRPIVLLNRKKNDRLAPSVAYDNRYYGFMLPYTPVHHLILRDNFDALVMTSANLAEEPIAIGNTEAIERLADIADYFLLHDREILQRCDDSIVRIAGGSTRIIRRARGFVPQPVYLNTSVTRPILCCGGELKNTIALAREDQIYLSQHIGDLDNPAALGFFEECIKHLKQVLQVEPELIAYDLHPEYLSTKWAMKQTELPTVGVQHHHAHLASVLADNRVEGPAIGIILDGTGYGTDGTIWGGEVLYGDASEYERLGWLEPVPMPGGAAAIKQPWRMAISYLHHAYGDDLASMKLPFMSKLEPEALDVTRQMIARGLNSPLTSSCGRLFDGVAAILNLCNEAHYEAQAAIELEMISLASSPLLEKAPPIKLNGPLSIDWLVRAVVDRVLSGDSVEQIAGGFHLSLAELFINAARAARDKTGCESVALSGGVFQNRLFFEYILDRLKRERFNVYCHQQVPTNDGGLALGQAVIADAVTRQ